MELGELKQALAATDPSAILVSPRILRRVLQAEFKVPYLLMRVPHERCYFFDRQILFRHVEQDELDLEPDHLLPPTVILLARPTAEQMREWTTEVVLARYWRLLFHAQVHVALHRRHQEGHLTPADVRARVEQIGTTEFGEIRTVLKQETDLLPPASDLDVYVEFVAIYLELRCFRSNLLSTYFPSIQDFKVIDRLMAADVDADALFARTRLPGALDPVVCTDTSSDESHDYYWKLVRHAERAARDGDLVRAAIVRTKAARVAPPAMAQQTRAEALRDVELLTRHLQDALKFSPEEAAEWLQVLPSLLEKADQGQWPVEAKLLYDLQKISQEYESKLYALDVVEWGLSAGKRPIKRALNGLQIVRPVNHLRSAAQRLTMARVSDEDRQRLARLIQSALHESEERLRERFRPILIDAFHDVGLASASPPEQVALQKMIEEILDRIMDNGFFTFTDLRDTISSNQLKLPDLPDPQSFWRGDPLLRLDRRLATPMEGVYQPGEFYLRWMESCSSLFFGTAVGRFFTRNVLIPFGGAFLLIQGMLFLWNHYRLSQAVEVPVWTFLPVGCFLLSLLHFEMMRYYLADAGARTFRVLRLVLYEVPARIAQLPRVQQFFSSWPFLLLYWYLLQPLCVVALLWFWWRDFFGSWPIAVTTFLLADLLLNSNFGRAASEAVKEAVSLLYSWLRFDALRGLIRMVEHFFKQVTETVESLLYSVDEWLRFRNEENQLTQAVRAVMGVAWFPVRYVVRLYFIMLIEPSLNPLKLPISILAAKFFVIIPGYVQMMIWGSEVQEGFIQGLAPHMSLLLAKLFTWAVFVPTLWLLPSAVAFIIWEMKGNWRLFRANRPIRFKPIVVGGHGERVLQLLRPGAHSGTIPKLFADLRRAERGAYKTNNWRAARTYRQELKEVARSVQVFVEREFVALLHQSKSWPNQPLRVAQVILSCTRIRIELTHAEFPGELVSLALEERSGWLIGGLREAGWLTHLTAKQHRILTTALAGLYKLAGVDIVREQLAIALPPSQSGFQLTNRELVVWTDRHDGQAITYDLRGRPDQFSPYPLNGSTLTEAPQLDAHHLLFSRVVLTWEQWVRFWQDEGNGEERPQAFGESVILLPMDRKAKEPEPKASSGS